MASTVRILVAPLGRGLLRGSYQLGVEAGEKELAAAKLIVQQPALCNLYSEFFGTLHPAILKELQAMARTTKKGPKFHLKPLVDLMGMGEAIEQLGEEQVLDHFAGDPKRMKKAIAFFLSHMSDTEREELKRKLRT